MQVVQSGCGIYVNKTIQVAMIWGLTCSKAFEATKDALECSKVLRRFQMVSKIRSVVQNHKFCFVKMFLVENARVKHSLSLKWRRRSSQTNAFLGYFPQ